MSAILNLEVKTTTIIPELCHKIINRKKTLHLYFYLTEIPGTREIAFRCNDFSRLLIVAILDVDVKLTSKLKK